MAPSWMMAQGFSASGRLHCQTRDTRLELLRQISDKPTHDHGKCDSIWCGKNEEQLGVPGVKVK
jgi:hypothetical protein